MLKLEPYLKFNGNCEEAFNFYKAVFRSEFVGLMRYKDLPEGAGKNSIGEEDMEKILHLSLPVGKTVILMGSDVSSEMHVDMGNNISLSLSIEEEDEVRRLFGELSQGGKVIMPLQKTFWADLYGACTDKFGIDWMVSRAKGEDV